MQRDSGNTLWSQIADALRTSIKQGVLTAGQRLPTEFELATGFGVNRHTVRQAVAHLTEQGLLQVQQGRGTFVREDVLDYVLGAHTRFTQNILSQERSPKRTVLSDHLQRPAKAIAVALKLAPRERCVCLESLSMVDGRPYGLSTHYFPNSRFAGLADHCRENGSISDSLVVFGVLDYRRARTQITTRLPTQHEAELLQQPRTQPVLLTESLNVDLNGAPIEWGITCFAAARAQLIVDSISD